VGEKSITVNDLIKYLSGLTEEQKNFDIKIEGCAFSLNNIRISEKEIEIDSTGF
jgi:hypothetical protein